MACQVWYDGKWHAEPPRLLSPLDHAFFMASSVFDGARAFGGAAPDLEQHCERLIRSAEAMLLTPPVTAAEVQELCREGVRRFPGNAELYIRPMIFARRGWVMPDSASADFCLVLDEMPMPAFTGLRVAFSRYRRPARDMAITEAKAGCLYPNMQRALAEATKAGFDNAITTDANGNVAELATANLWIVQDGTALTPAANGTFLAGVTRGRVLELLQADGIPAREAVLTPADVLEAEEVFSTGNFAKVLPVTQVAERSFQPGPVTRRARELYWRFAADQLVG